MRALLALVALALLVAPAAAREATFAGWDGAWVESSTGDTSIEIPSFLMDGPAHGVVHGDEDDGTIYDGVNDFSLTVQQWRVPSDTERPFVFLTRVTAGQIKSIIYSLDKPGLGVISGYQDGKRQQGYYSICRPGPNELRCIAMIWDTADHAVVSMMIDRMVKSFEASP